MKTKIFLFGLLSLCIYSACDDTVNNVGMGTQPDEDKISVYDTIITIDSAYTIKFDSIYAKTINGYLGNFYDPDYGDLKAGFICQYYPSVAFADTGILKNASGKEIDSVRMNIFYTTYIGDSLTPMEVSIYPVTKKAVDENYYTNIKPADYCNLNTPWAKKTYSARDLNVPDSVYKQSTYYKNISISLPTEWGQEIYDKYKEDKTLLTSLNKFKQLFPGTYVESSFGTGNLINVDIIDIYIYYRTHYLNSEDRDTTVTTRTAFTLTNEVMQMNSFKTTSDNNLLQANDERMYLKTPVGIFSEIVIPIPKIAKSIGKRQFSSVKLDIGAYAQTEKQYPLPLPGIGDISSTTRSALLLIERDSVTSFFENQQVANSKTTFVTQYSSSSMSYNFNNISNLIQNAIDKAPDQNLHLLLVPVVVYYATTGYYRQDYFTTHYLAPSAVTLKKGGNNLRLQIIASDINKNR